MTRQNSRLVLASSLAACGQDTEPRPHRDPGHPFSAVAPIPVLELGSFASVCISLWFLPHPGWFNCLVFGHMKSNTYKLFKHKKKVHTCSY